MIIFLSQYNAVEVCAIMEYGHVLTTLHPRDGALRRCYLEEGCHVVVDSHALLDIARYDIACGSTVKFAVLIKGNLSDINRGIDAEFKMLTPLDTIHRHSDHCRFAIYSARGIIITFKSDTSASVSLIHKVILIQRFDVELSL